MPIAYRCYDIFGYCNSPKHPRSLMTERVDGKENFSVLDRCRFNPATCKHYLTSTESLSAAGLLTQEGEAEG